MGGVFDELGILTVDVGDGVLSAHEVTQLAVGDVVKVDQIAGDPATV